MSCTIEDCGRPIVARGWCQTHWKRWKRHGDPRHGERTPLAVLVENVEWMAETGETLTGACRRLDTTPNALEVRLRRAGRSDLYRALASREGERRQGEVA